MDLSNNQSSITPEYEPSKAQLFLMLQKLTLKSIPDSYCCQHPTTPVIKSFLMPF